MTPDRYKWVVLSNTTIGVLLSTINSSILLIALPDIFRGIHLDPLQPANTSYLLWLIMGFLVVTAVLVVSFGRIGDMFGRVRMYNLGFAVFTVFSILLAVTWMDGAAGALWLIVMRILQGVGGALLIANAPAIVTDAFPREQRGLALGINSLVAIAGTFIGSVVGGALAPVNWRLIFLVSVPFGLFGTVWAYLKLVDNGVRQPAKLDWKGNVTFAAGLVGILVAMTYGIQPYRGHDMGWTNPWVLGGLAAGLLVLALFVWVERRVQEPMFDLALFRLRPFSAGNIASLMSGLGRGGLQFVLIIWLQGVWLPLHGYSFERTPLWAGIYMTPLTLGFLVAAPIGGHLSDRYGARLFTAGGSLLTALGFGLLLALPVNFSYVWCAPVLLLTGLGNGFFAAPNRAAIMNSVPARRRGVSAGMAATFQNSAAVLSIGIFFTLMVLGMSGTLPAHLSDGLTSAGVPAVQAHAVASVPPVATLFAALLGENPVARLLGPGAAALPAGTVAHVTSRTFFPAVVASPFRVGLELAFGFALVTCAVAAVASWLRGPLAPAGAEPVEAVVSEELQPT